MDFPTLDTRYTIDKTVRLGTDLLNTDSNNSIVMLMDKVTSNSTSWDVYKWIHSNKAVHPEVLEQLSNIKNHIKL